MKIKKNSDAIRVPPIKKAIKVKRKSSDTENESTVTKAIESVKKILEKKNVKARDTVVAPKVNRTYRVIKPKRKPRNRRKKRGIVYVGHIPHGFYEEQMTEYFKQFGRVTNVRLVRSKNSGKSCGYGYVEFMYPKVAEIAAETMNNYLMCGRLLKATYIPPEKQHDGFFTRRSWTKDIYPKVINRKRITRIRNRNISNEIHSNFIQSTKHKLSALEKKLKDKGFDMEFKPVNDGK
ncbi:MKI67 FHA domain-interacting nucleolar phosphoprotein-like [Xylocopa sonorina]|uniref:MKI67 FHA domain-interacting nucleolar phosphoprotein-like n=1 Tax=Xylocopa sonorina TaxID=1818115 RepID=UPI00403A89B7